MQQTHVKTGVQCNDDVPVWSASAIVNDKAGTFYLGLGKLTDDHKLSARYVCLAQADNPKVKTRCLSGLAVSSNAALKTGDKIVITPVASKDGGATWDARNEIAVTLDGKDSKTAQTVTAGLRSATILEMGDGELVTLRVELAKDFAGILNFTLYAW